MSLDATPTRVFDAHLHIIDPRFPLVPNNGFVPEPFTASDYRSATEGLHIRGGAVVSGSFQAFDQSYLLDALVTLGPGFVGVTQLPADVDDARIAELDHVGVRAVRFNLYRGGSTALEDLERLAHRVYDVAGWHSELYVDAGDLPDLEPLLRRLPKISIDHLGLNEHDDGALLRLVEVGARVKATGFGRVDINDIEALLRRIVGTNPEALMFGTDLPSTRAPIPFRASDVERVVDAVGDELADRVLWANAAQLYRV